MLDLFKGTVWGRHCNVLHHAGKTFIVLIWSYVSIFSGLFRSPVVTVGSSGNVGDSGQAVFSPCAKLTSCYCTYLMARLESCVF